MFISKQRKTPAVGSFFCMKRFLPVIALLFSAAVLAQNTPPSFVPGPKVRHAVYGQTACISLSTTDNDSNDTVRISWSSPVATASFTNNNGAVKHASGEICWTPQKADVSPSPYPFVVYATDGALSVSDTFLFYVLGIPERTNFTMKETCGWVEIDVEVNEQTTMGNIVIRDSLNRSVASSAAYSLQTYLTEGEYYVHTTLRDNTPTMNLYVDTLRVVQSFQQQMAGPTKLAGKGMYEMSVSTNYSKPLEYHWYHMYFGQRNELPEKSNTLQVQLWENAVYQVVAINDYGCYDTAEWSVLVEPNGLDAVDAGISVYPNPASKGFWIETFGEEMSQVRLLTLTGKELFVKPASGNKVYFKFPEAIASGIYFLEIIGKEGQHHLQKMQIE